MQARFRVFHQQQRAGVTVETNGALGLQERRKQPQQNHPMGTATGPVDHPVNDIEVTPAALFIVRAAAHQTMTRLRRPLLGKIVFQQLYHCRQPLADLTIGQILRTRHQLSRQEIQLAGSHFHFRHIRYGAVADPPHKTRITQAQHRHQANQVASQVVDVIQRNRVGFLIEEITQG